MERIVFLERGTLVADVRRPRFAHEWREYEATRPEQAVERLRGATIAVVNKLPLGESELAELPDLKLIAVAATGTDNLDLDACRRRGVAVVNVRGYAVETVPEHVLLLLLALRRSLLGWRADVRAGAWAAAPQFCLHTRPISDLRGTTLGVVGYGTLGQAVARLCAAVGMDVLVAERKGAAEVRAGRVPFAEVLSACDALTLHAPLNAETRHLVGAAELRRMKPSAVLVNCGRGGLVDEAALGAALRDGVIAGAGVDVLTREPPAAGNPLLELDLPNLIVTPHVAWASRQAMQTLADQLIANIEKAVTSDE
ncbi:MAG TPA: D-2-hydroxyacid dehydrogenase [Pyrinomonadaceae bacterium]|jgi:glycerate dehydrogenase